MPDDRALPVAFRAALAPARFTLARLPERDEVDRALEHVEVRASGVVAGAMTFDDDAALAAAVALPRAVQVAAPYRQPDGSYRFAQPLKYRIVAVNESPYRRRR